MLYLRMFYVLQAVMWRLDDRKNGKMKLITSGKEDE